MSIERGPPKVDVDQEGSFVICEDAEDAASDYSQQAEAFLGKSCSIEKELIPLVTSKMENMSTGPNSDTTDQKEDKNVTPKIAAKGSSQPSSDVKELLAKLAEQQRLIDQQREALTTKEKELDKVKSEGHSGSSSFSTTPVRMAADSGSAQFNDIVSPLSIDTSDSYGFRPVTQFKNFDEVNRLQSELEAAQNRITSMNEELAQNRITRHTIDQALSQSGDDSSHLGEDVSEQTLATLQTAFAQSTRPNAHRSEPWISATSYEDPSLGLTPDYVESQSFNAGNYARHSGIWNDGPKPSITQMPALPLPTPAEVQFSTQVRRPSVVEHGDVYGSGSRAWNNHRSFTSQAPQGPPVSSDTRYAPRRASYNPQAMPFIRSSYEHGTTGVDRVSPTSAYTPSPIGTPHAPTTPTDFTAASNASTVWGSQSSVSGQQGQTYVSTIEPLNYRRLLERSVNCNWKYIVDKIICNNDQQASIFLQQKLKIGTVEQKHSIVDAIVSQAYPLMVNRFGNFLVQRCFEHGTQKQIDGIASAIRGNCLTLSMDAFGCHVVQKAFDCVTEDFKAVMVSELLRRIPETVIHRYACHVWQKLFELRWTDSPPQIMKYVNEALHGMWHDVALGETGSLVVQNIFENCLEEDKRPCITEVLASIDLIAHGQFGNWCIQHICEHGAPLDRGRAVDVVIENAAEYSMDQFASKVVEKCLKIGGNEFLDRYLDRVCEGRADRPRIPLIDIASDQYGNYLVQWILQHSSPTHREQVASHIRKHMVSLRGSKFGSRVGMLCCNSFYNRPSGSPSPSVPRFNRYGYR